MALPVAKAATLASDMASKGIGGVIAMKKPPAEDDPPDGGGGTVADVLADIDDKVPGLGSLIQELFERLRAEDDEDEA